MIKQSRLIELLSSNNWNYSITASALGISRTNLYTYIKKYNIVRPAKFNESYFSNIDTDDKAYFLGYLMADGCVIKKLNRVDFGIHKKDIDILYQFKSYLKSSNTVRQYGIIAIINHTSKKLVCDLERHGCTQRKSLSLVFPKTISQEYIWSFIRGYFDGDGCATTHMPSTNKNRIRINFIGTKEFLTELQTIFKTDYKLSPTGTFKRAFKLEITSKASIEYIVSNMYKNATVKLDRKYNICKHYIQENL